MNKAKGFHFLGLGILGAIAMGIGCAHESQDSKVEPVKTSTVKAAQPENLNVAITLKDEPKHESVGAQAAEAPMQTPVPPIATDTMISPENQPGSAAGIGPGLGAPGLGLGGFGGPGIDGIGPGFGGWGGGFGGPGFDVPFGPGFDEPIFGLGFPFYVADVIVIDDEDHHRRRRHHHSHDDDNRDDDLNNDDDSNDDDVVR